MKFRYEPGDEVGIGGGTRTVHAVVVQDNGATVTVNNIIDEIAPSGGQVFTVDRSNVHPSPDQAVPYSSKRAQGDEDRVRSAKNDLRDWLKANDPTYWSWIQGIGIGGSGPEPAIVVGYRGLDAEPPILARVGKSWHGVPVQVRFVGGKSTR